MIKRKEFIKALGRTGQERLRVKLTIDKDRLIDFVFQYESLIDENWCEIVRYDLAHGFFHRDFILPKGDNEKTKLEMPDIKTAATYAEQDIVDKWEFYKTKYLKNLKKKIK
ncbi:MAG: hypothetical protein HY738_13645 [Bacteroidia bacterium]|nr:hypothetical protein [Bacteroidia bacterium]